MLEFETAIPAARADLAFFEAWTILSTPLDYHEDD
jgi:hypothetical protein